MKNLFTYLKALWGAWGNLQSTDVSFDCRRSDLRRSPSGLDAKWKQNPFMRFAVVLTLIFTIGSGNAWGADGDVAYTLQMSDYYSGTKPSGYAATQDLVFGTVSNNKTWNVPGNVTLGNYFAIGGTGLSNTDRVITGKSTITNIIKEVRVNYSKVTNGKSSSLTLKSAKLEVSSNSSFTQIVETVNKTSLNITSSSGSGSISFTPSSDNWASGKYYRITFTCTTTGSKNSHFDVTSIVFIEGAAAASDPTITTSVSSLTEVGYSTADFSQQVKSFTVSGSSLTANVTVTAPTNYEVCKTSGGTYTSSVSFDKGSGTLEASTVYVRLQSGKTAGNYNGNVACTSDEATTKNVAVSGSVPFTVTWKANGTTHATTYVTYATGSGTALGSLPDDPDPSDYTCSPKVFYGWYDGASYSDASVAPSVISTSTKITTDKTYNAVFATESNGSATYEIAGSSITGFDGGNGAYESGTYNTGDGFTIYCSNGYSTTQFRIAKSASITITSTIGDITQIVFTASGTDYKLNNNNISWTGTTGTYTNSGASTITLSNSNANIARITNIAITYGGTTYSNYETNCCTPLGTINGSNLSTSSTGTSVSVSVLTEGVNAYGDANNVSGYEFKLYTAASGGSAAATYSSNSKAGTSHTFTGLIPLTQYWVTVRPIGDGSTYCNTTAESSRVQITTLCVAPNHVDISGRWDRFGGETISLTATAYSSAGTSSPIDAENITGYQWQKLISSTWTDVSDGTTDGVTTSGATTNNLQISNCKLNNSGKYRCIISTGAGCTTASATATDGTEGFDVKVYVLECYTGGTTVYNFTRVGDTQAGTAQITLTAGNKEFKVHADNYYYGKNVTINEDENNVVLCNSGDAVCSANLTIAAGLGGTFTFTMDYSTSGSSSVEGEPELSITYPRKTIYLTPGVWNSGEAKFAFYYFRKVGETIYGEGFTDFITADDCGSYTDIPQWNGVKINAVRLNSNTTASDLTNSANHYKAAWDKKWNQTSDITITSNNSISITGWGPQNEDSPYDYGTYSVPTYTISYATGSVPTGGGSISGSKANETKTCGVDFDLPAAQFTTTGYVQTGWAKTDGGAQYAAVSGSYTDNSAQTFYPVWTANTHTLTWDKNGGDALTGDYTSGTVAYGTAITAPNTPTWTGHTFNGWHNGSSIVTPATTMPDNDLSYTAQWSLASYTVTLNVNGGTINASNVTSYTYGTGATLPTNVTRDGYRFDGWFSDDGVWSDQVTAISTTATGDKTYYAKWTQVYTVTWSVNGETWSSGVVDGNTYVVDGQRVSALPTAPTSSDCDDSKVFVGWRATAIDGTSVSDPGSIFTTQAASPAITGNTTFYAVFADKSGGDFTRVTSTSQLAANKEIIMGYEDTPNSGEIVPVQSGTYDSSKNLLYTGTTSGSAGYATIDMSSITYENAANYIFTLKAGYNSGYWAFEMSGDNAGYYIGHKGRNVIDKHEGIQNDGKTDFAISFGTNDTASIVNKYGTENTTSWTSSGSTKYGYFKYLSYNYNNGTPRVSIYQTTQTGALVLYIANPLVYSNYVTTCSSCDADATFTNTTPAVSDIDCTSATLTATGGLATVGADGCHVSDYGFVIGTSDNPVIGGSGVTKLQVGTSDPTIGEDFSHDATGLTKGTHYYIRAYAINRHGTAYSSSTNFWTNNVSSIAITTAPTKTNYIVGETFDATGMVVTATMADSNTEDVTSDVTYSSSTLTAGTSQNFAINYTLCETEKSVNQVINVYTLTVTEGTNPSYGTATNSSANIVSITGLGDHKTYTVTVTSSNATAVDNGDNTWSIINPTGNVTVRVDYADAVQVKVYYKVDGVTVTGLTRDVYQSETTTLPTASALATAMTAQSMDLPDDDYPNFVGWSETEFPAQTAEPTIVTGTPTINAEKTYYAVYTNLSKITIIPSDFSTSYPSSGSADGTKTFGSKRFGWNYLLNGNVSKTNLPLQFKKNSTEYGRLYNTDPLNYILRLEIGYYDATSNVPVYVASSAGTISGGALTPASRESTDPYVYTMPASTSYFYIKGDNSTVYKIRSVDIYYSPATVYYMTQFCTNRVTLTQNSPEHGTVEFGRSSLVTCGSDKNVSLTIIPDVGYQLTGWTVNTSSGYADAKTTSPAVVTNSNNSAAQNITLTFAEDANKDYDVTATFGLMTVTSWVWTVNSAAIPDPLNLYVGQSARLDVAYTPAGVDASKKTYGRTKEDAYINWVGGAYATYSTISGKASTGENTTPVTFTHGDGPTTTVNVKVLPLPAVHFGDIVHNVEFADVVATLSDNTLSPTKTTPTHADFEGSTANQCEEQHLHLVGWIREDWPALVTYLNGGSKPSTDDITGAGNDGSGNAYFFAPGASINTQTFNGVTFYAVWAKVE